MEITQGNQSNISQHLNCLKGCGIILGRQEGKYVHYSLRNKQIEQLLTMFDVVFHEVQNEVASCDKNDACLSQKEKTVMTNKNGKEKQTSSCCSSKKRF